MHSALSALLSRCVLQSLSNARTLVEHSLLCRSRLRPDVLSSHRCGTPLRRTPARPRTKAAASASSGMWAAASSLRGTRTRNSSASRQEQTLAHSPLFLALGHLVGFCALPALARAYLLVADRVAMRTVCLPALCCFIHALCSGPLTMSLLLQRLAQRVCCAACALYLASLFLVAAPDSIRDSPLLQCPPALICNATGITWDRVQLNSGYWRASNESDQFLQCLRAVRELLESECASIVLVLPPGSVHPLNLPISSDAFLPCACLLACALGVTLHVPLAHLFLSNAFDTTQEHCVGGRDELCGAHRVGALCAACLVRRSIACVQLRLVRPSLSASRRRSVSCCTFAFRSVLADLAASWYFLLCCASHCAYVAPST